MLRSIGEIVDSVQFVTVDELPSVADPKAIYCPLTLNVTPTFKFWGQSIGRSCQDIDRLRDLAATTTGVKVGSGGNLWLPIIWTARDPIYGEVIGMGKVRAIIIASRFNSTISIDDHFISLAIDYSPNLPHRQQPIWFNLVRLKRESYSIDYSLFQRYPHSRVLAFSNQIYLTVIGGVLRGNRS